MPLHIGRPLVSFEWHNSRGYTSLEFLLTHSTKSQVVVYSGRLPYLLLKASDIDIHFRYHPKQMERPIDLLEAIQQRVAEWATAATERAQIEISRGRDAAVADGAYYFARYRARGEPVHGLALPEDTVLHESYFD